MMLKELFSVDKKMRYELASYLPHQLVSSPTNKLILVKRLYKQCFFCYFASNSVYYTHYLDD